ncbi:MAG: DUF1624 domain-containing protein [Acidobacteria bacterium]|nr:DUF1624 domain-containing protein [Acidobacteriota bacterium]
MKRFGYIDWMRGFACVVMFQTHCYNSWLSPDAKRSGLYAWSQLGGTLPAPLFIFLAGISFALVTEKLRDRGTDRNAIAKQTILRGAEIFGLGILFRIQELVLGIGVAPWTDLFRVDILNMLGISMIMMGVLCWLTGRRSYAVALAQPTQANTLLHMRNRSIAAALASATAVAIATPFIWNRRFSLLPWEIETYFNGVHTFKAPQPWLFPMFPWIAFAFAGLAVGFFLFSDFAKQRQDAAFFAIGGTGIAACLLAIAFDLGPVRIYDSSIYDYWHTSSNFLLMRCGILLIILFLSYAWCRWGVAERGFSPIIQLGQTSLLVYWVHIEFVYGRLSILPKGNCGIALATLGLATILVAMVALSIWRTRWKKRAERPAAAVA